MKNPLDKRIALATSCHWISVKVDKLKFTEWLKHLLDITLGKVEM
jgi:hypothetical protein